MSEDDFSGPAKEFQELKLGELKELVSLEDLAINLSAFGCEFQWVVQFCKECGYGSFTETKLIEILSQNIDALKTARNKLNEDRLKYLMLSSSDVLPKLSNLYDKSIDLLNRADSEDNYRAASQLVGNTAKILELIGKVNGMIHDAETKIQVNIFGHVENFNLLKKFQSDGLIQIVDESNLKKRLGFQDKPADFIESFRSD